VVHGVSTKVGGVLEVAVVVFMACPWVAFGSFLVWLAGDVFQDFGIWYSIPLVATAAAFIGVSLYAWWD
jgi:hypothetical protein